MGWWHYNFVVLPVSMMWLTRANFYCNKLTYSWQIWPDCVRSAIAALSVCGPDIRVDSALSLPPGLLASVLFLCVRQADCSGDHTQARSLCCAAVKAMKAALKVTWVLNLPGVPYGGGFMHMRADHLMSDATYREASTTDFETLSCDCSVLHLSRRK